MATIRELMPHLEQGLTVEDPIRKAWLKPIKQDDALVFEWTAYNGEGEWRVPEVHTLECVLTWNSNNWSIEGK
jgi:hypothetical protein